MFVFCSAWDDLYGSVSQVAIDEEHTSLQTFIHKSEFTALQKVSENAYKLVLISLNFSSFEFRTSEFPAPWFTFSLYSGFWLYLIILGLNFYPFFFLIKGFLLFFEKVFYFIDCRLRVIRLVFADLENVLGFCRPVGAVVRDTAGGAGGLGLDSRADQIGLSVACDSSPLRRFFEAVLPWR